MVSVVTTGNGTAVSGTQPTISVPANSATSLRATWANICAAFVDGTNGCQDMREDQSFRVGIDKDGDSQLSTGDDFITVNIKVRDPQVDPLVVPNFATVFNPADLDPATSLCATVGAICNFSLERGDQKATIQDLSFGTSGLDTNYKQIAFFCAVQDTSGLINFSSINRECTNPVDISGANALVEDTITGLNNDVEHFFRAAIIDEAGNYGLFFRGDNDPTVCASTGLPSCHSVVPEEVVGLFRDTNCFVATAAFGSPMEKQVKTLRRFRDQVLSKSSFGQMFVKLYYQVSPPMARWIAQSPLRRSVTRGALTPVIFSVALAMDHPIWFGLILISLVSALIIWLRRSRETLT